MIQQVQLFRRAVPFLKVLKKNFDSLMKASGVSQPCMAFLRESLPKAPLIELGD